MLFSYRVKNEIARIIPEDITAQKDELLAFLILKGKYSKKNQDFFLTIDFDNSATTRKFYNLSKNIFGIYPVVKTKKMTLKRKQYAVEILSKENIINILKEFGFTGNFNSTNSSKLVYQKK